MSRPLSVLRSSSECFFKSQRRCLHSLEPKRRFGEGSVSRVLAARRYAATATARLSERSGEQRSEYLDDEELDDSSAYSAQQSRTILYPKQRPRADPKPIVEHLKHLFPPLEFPDTVATQMMTHISAKEAWAGHNARLAFVGRRVLQSYLLLFLQEASEKLARTTSPPAVPYKTFDFDHIAYRALFTQILGEYVGAHWDLARTMLWTPPVRSGAKKERVLAPLTRHYEEEEERRVQETPDSLKSPGLYKVQGTVVEGIMGGVFHQFGGSIAQRVFHTRLLPHILCPGTPFGLHDAFHPAALEMQKRMGGPNGLLISSPELSQRRSSEVWSQPSPSLHERVEKRAAHSSTEIAQTSRQRIPL